MTELPRRIAFAFAAMLICVLFSIIVIGGAAAFLIFLSFAAVISPIAILIAGPGPIGARITRRRRPKDDIIDA